MYSLGRHPLDSVGQTWASAAHENQRTDIEAEKTKLQEGNCQSENYVLAFNSACPNCLKTYTIVRVDVAGWSNGKPNRVVYQLIDRRDMKSGFTAMQRTVGFTMSIGARQILEGSTLRHGLVSPVEIPPALLQSKLAQ